MDKWEKKVFLKIFIVFNILIIAFSIVKNWSNIDEAKHFIKIFILGEILLIIIPICVINIFKKKRIQPLNNLHRETNNEYTPAMASVLIDYRVENNKDILATILDLSVRKYLEITNESEIKINEKDINTLYSHEQYVINQIKNKDYIRVDKFKEFVIDDCKDKGLLKDKYDDNSKNKILKIMAGFFIGSVICFVLTYIFEMIESFEKIYEVFKYLPAILFGLCLLAMTFLGKNKRTKEGIIAAEECRGFKEYLKEYTLIKTRDVEHINVLDRNLTYALALGEADIIEDKFMRYNKLLKKYVFMA